MQLLYCTAHCRYSCSAVWGEQHIEEFLAVGVPMADPLFL